MSSSALNQIIASSFGVDRQPGKTFLAARDNARIMDSNMAAADVAQRINENNLRMQQKAAADQAALGPALLEILNAPQEQYGISRQQAEYDAARANMLENWQGQQPPDVIDPSLFDAQGKPVGAALDYLNAPQAAIEGEQAALNERQQKAYELLAGNPAYQEQMIESMFATPDPRFQQLSPEQAASRGLPTENGEVWGIEADGTPSLVFTPNDLNDSTARTINFERYKALSPADRKLFVESNGKITAEQLILAGLAEKDDVETVVHDLAAAKAGGTAMGTTSVEQHAKMRETIQPMRNALAEMYRARNLIATGPVTGLATEWLTRISGPRQALGALLKDQLFARLSAAKAGGATFGSMTEGEWRNLEATVSNLGNTREGNLAIVDAMIAKIETQLGESLWVVDNYKPGELTPINRSQVAPLPLQPVRSGVLDFNDLAP